MSARQILLLVTGVGAVLCLVLMGMTIVRHAEGVETIQGINVVLTEVRVTPDGDNPLEVTLKGESTSGQYDIHSIRFVVRRGEAIVGARPEVFVTEEVSEAQAALMQIPVEPGSNFQDAQSLERLIDVDPSEWVVYGSMVVQPLNSRATVDKEFRLLGVGRN